VCVQVFRENQIRIAYNTEFSRFPPDSLIRSILTKTRDEGRSEMLFGNFITSVEFFFQISSAKHRHYADGLQTRGLTAIFKVNQNPRSRRPVYPVSRDQNVSHSVYGSVSPCLHRTSLLVLTCLHLLQRLSRAASYLRSACQNAKITLIFTVFGRPFVKRFALCYQSVLSALPVLFVCPVCDDGVLWPSSCMDQKNLACRSASAPTTLC